MSNIITIYKKHVKGTSEGEHVPDVEASLCNVGESISKALALHTSHVKITARAIKHMQDRIMYQAKKPRDFSLLLHRLPKVITNPDKVCRNKQGRRGDFAFLKEFNQKMYLSTIEVVENKILYVVTGFLPKHDYYKKMKILWKL